MLPAIEISDHLSLPTYLLWNSLLFCFLLFIVRRRAERAKLSLSHALNLSLVIMLASFFGARLFHVFYEEWSFYKQDLAKILYFWQGGFVFYGGALASAISGYLYLKWYQLPAGKWFDFFTPVAALGTALGRGSCFLAGCCYGHVCNLPWAVEGRHPTQLYEMAWDLLAYFVVIKKEQRSRLEPGALFLMWVALYSAGRLVVEQFRDDFRGNFFYGLSISSWLSLGLLIVSGVGLILHQRKVAK